MTTPLMVIDPILLGMPTEEADQDEVTDYFERIIRLQNFIQSSAGVKLAISSCVQNSLSECGIFPFGNCFTDMLKAHRLTNVWSVSDLVKSFNRLLQQAGIIEDEIGVDEAIYDSVNIIPNEVVNCAHPSMERSRERGLVLGILPYTDCVTEKRLSYLITNVDVYSASIEINLHAIEGENVDCSIALPRTIKHDLPIAEWSSDFLRLMKASDVWRYAETSAELRLSIKLGAWDLLREKNSNTKIESVPDFFIGEEFFRSLVKNNAAHEGSTSNIVLEACARLVAGIPKEEMHSFLNEKGKQKKRTHDEALAWRIHLTKRHEALRLMVWQLKNGAYEFANIGPKKELVIC